MKKTIILSLLLLTSICVSAQQPKFDPAKFDADLEQFITTEACLSPQQASAFFPVYREMLRKERVLFDQMRRYRHRDTSDDAACRDAI
jgi:hypothetical protein